MTCRDISVINCIVGGRTDNQILERGVTPDIDQIQLWARKVIVYFSFCHNTQEVRSAKGDCKLR